ncbi:MAG: hypothetical protein F6K18_13440 [Okeania sp. SIO2C2]|uniref:hypothetical protein n=1 Tax=Okeania sp. SIO2C2 TaxID=2607787 RepID=UPI0013BD29E3|nr:hypothetical protein [Okeania sp. SIO2C2]NEP87738.1 hypothetical protein [Okeania sp. SIO2C2]
MGDGRHQNPGAKPLLDEQQQALLVQALEGEPPGGGRWSGPKVGVWMSELLGGPVSSQGGWEDLRGLEYAHQSASPRSCFSF